MLPKLILLVSLGLFWWLIRRDIRQREGLSPAIWIPTLWVGIIASRNLSAWVGFGGAADTLDGSPVDRLFFLVMIVAAGIVLQRRGILWSSVFRNGWPVFLFYGFLLISVLWANSPFSSFKRWFKEFGNILVLLVILTEAHPLLACRAVFARCAYVLIPLSVVFIRYFPDLGRRYSEHSGELEPIGVTFQKNSLGVMVLTCAFVMLWDWFELQSNRHFKIKSERRTDNILHLVVLLMGIYLLYLCDSKTSIVCMALGGCILLATRSPLFRSRLSMIGGCTLAALVGFFVLDQLFGFKEAVVHALGRDMTFTGRTDVWRELLGVHTDPILGTGFMSFWDDKGYRSMLPEWVAFSAHNGYLDVYLAGGYVGVFFLALMVLATGLRINSALAWGEDYSVVRFAIFVVALIANFSESNFACMTPVGFLFLLAAIGYADTAASGQTVSEPVLGDRRAGESNLETGASVVF